MPILLQDSQFIQSAQARTQDFEKGGSDYHGEGECVGGEYAPPHEAQTLCG